MRENLTVWRILYGLPVPVQKTHRRVILSILAGTCILLLSSAVTALALSQHIPAPSTVSTPASASYIDLKAVIYGIGALGAAVAYVVYNRATINRIVDDHKGLADKVSFHIDNSAIHQESLSRELVDSKLETIHQRINNVTDRVDRAEVTLGGKIDDLKLHITRTVNGHGPDG